MNITEIYEKANKYDFSNIDICTKNQAINLIICHIKKINMTKFYTSMNEIILSKEEVTILFKYLDELIYNKIPLQYIIGEVPFYKEKYIVTKDVLIPRQDTEILVDKAIEYINRYNLKNALDLCSGSGAIGISISNNSKINCMHFVDVSKNALEIINKNIIKNDVTVDTKIIYSNLFENLMTTGYKYDIIVSNPPYIPTNDIDNLSEYVKREPRLALDGGISGLDFYIKIIDKARDFLKDNGYLMFEIGYNQMESLSKIFSNYVEYEILEKVKDLNSNDRVIICRFHKI